jgi:hypothetical protein
VNAVQLRTDSLQDEQSEHAGSEKCGEVDRLEQVATRELARAVAYPVPEAVFDPLCIWCRVSGRHCRKPGGHICISTPQDRDVVDLADRIITQDELQTDMNKYQPRLLLRNSVQADPQPRLTDLFPRNCRAQITILRRDCHPLPQHRRPVARLTPGRSV